MVSLKQKIIIQPDVLSQEVGGETVLLDLKSENYYGLDEIGTQVWQILKKEGSLETAFDALLNDYDVEEEQLKEDLQELLRQLVDAGMISLEP